MGLDKKGALAVDETRLSGNHPAWVWMRGQLADRRALMRPPSGRLVCHLAGLDLAPATVGAPISILEWLGGLSEAGWRQTLAQQASRLAEGGLLMLADWGPTSLQALAARLGPELSRQSGLANWRAQRVDMHDLGDGLVAAGLAEPVMESETLVLTYKAPDRLVDDLLALGVLGATGAGPGGPELRQALRAALTDQSGLSLSFEAVFGHAWRVPGRKPKRDPGDPMPLEFRRRT